MTRTHAAYQLLRHGPLSLDEFHAITGWPRKSARRTLDHMVQKKKAFYEGTTQHGIYKALAGAPIDQFMAGWVRGVSA